MLRAGVDRNFDAGLVGGLEDFLFRAFEKTRTFAFFCRDEVLYLFVDVGIDVLEAEVFQFVLDGRDTEAVGEGRPYVDGFLRDGALPVFGEIAEAAHLVEAVRETDYDDADVAHHGEKHLSYGFGLVG